MPAQLGASPALSVVTSDSWVLLEVVGFVVFLARCGVFSVSCFSPGWGQITVWFRYDVVVVSCGFCGVCFESTAPSALFSISFAPLRGRSCVSTQVWGARFSIIPSQHRSPRSGFEPGRFTRCTNLLASYESSETPLLVVLTLHVLDDTHGSLP